MRRSYLVGGALLAVGVLAGGIFALRPSPAGIGPGAAVDVPADELSTIVVAAAACPSLTPARVAAQLMANSGFNPTAVRPGGGTGIAGLTDTQWQRWAPDPQAVRTAPADNITALAHAMCDLVGELRATGLGGDPWRLALASFVVGAPAVVAAGGVPAGDAARYVATVDAYANWYDQQSSLAAASPTRTRTPAPLPLPTPAPSPSRTRGPVTPSPTAPRFSVSPVRSALGRIEAESFTSQGGAALESCVDTGGGQDVGSLAAGDQLRYAGLDFGPVGAGRFVVRFAGDLPAGMTGTIEVRLDSVSAAPIGGAAIASTGGWQSWTTITASITRVSGVHDVYLTFATSNGWEIGNLNWFAFAN